MGGGAPVAETRKQFVIMRLLGLRARRPEPFEGPYEPVDAGGHACAFVRGGDLFVVVAIRRQWDDGSVKAPRGKWRNLLHGDECTFGPREPLSSVLDEHGVGVFERVGLPNGPRLIQ
jgi:maltooligosyltrehalose synthase